MALAIAKQYLCGLSLRREDNGCSRHPHWGQTRSVKGAVVNLTAENSYVLLDNEGSITFIGMVGSFLYDRADSHLLVERSVTGT